MGRRLLAIAMPVAVGLMCIAGFAPAAAMATASAQPAGVRASSSHSSGSIPGNMIALYVRPSLERRAAAGDYPTNARASAAAPSGNVSPNLHFLSNLPLTSAISIAFIGDVAYVSTVLGLYSVDISDPTNPQLLGAAPQYIWENEHIQADPARHLVFISRDPRGFTSPASTAFPYGAIQVYDVSNPRAMSLIAFHLQPTGHTAGCINNCHYLWIAGPASPAVQVAGGAKPSWGGRPMWGEDITNPSNPIDCGHFLDLGNHGGSTDYDHDIDVDGNGVAWVSGSGHVRGYWTSGSHLNPLDGRVETATPCSPIAYAGGNTNEGQIKVQGGVMHNSSHNLSLAVDGRAGDVLTATEEVVTTDCTKAGHLVAYDLAGTYGGEGWTKPDSTLRRLGEWTPENQPGSTGCDSAHWFTDRGDGLLAQAFYSQGTRILDVRDPRHIRQLGYFNVSGTDTWAAYWHGHNEIVVADFIRGLDILRYDDVAASEQSTSPQTVGPSVAPAAVTSVLPNTSGRPGLGVTALVPLLGVTAVVAAGRRRRAVERAGNVSR
jgi:hypothetical protein